MRPLIIDVKEIIFTHDHCKINYKKMKISSISPTDSDLVRISSFQEGHTFIYFLMFYPDRRNLKKKKKIYVFQASTTFTTLPTAILQFLLSKSVKLCLHQEIPRYFGLMLTFIKFSDSTLALSTSNSFEKFTVISGHKQTNLFE